MFNLHHIKGNTYYIDGYTNIGLYKLNDKDVVLIDVPIKKYAENIYQILIDNDFNLKYIINTHSHPDHSGCNSFFLNKFSDCQIIASRVERAFLRNAKLDLALLYGGFPLNNFDTPLMHVDEQHDIRSFLHLPSGLRSFKLPGHHIEMRGIKTSDNVYFIADSICSKKLIDKEKIMLIYDVASYKKTLNFIKSLEGKIMVPSHDNISDSFSLLADYNLLKIKEIEDNILSILSEDKTSEDIVSEVLFLYNIKISYNKYLLMGSTIRSYIAYLNNIGKITSYFKENKLYFSLVK